jgi:KDO2-lipid IV(A) lauroyltransferase
MSILLRVLAALPPGLSYGLAWLTDLMLFYVLRYRRSTVRENLSAAFPEMSVAQRARIERESYRHLCNNLFEIIRGARMTQADFAARVHLCNVEVLEAATEHFQKQAIVLLIHQGNWEWLLHGATAQLPMHIDPVYKPLHSPFWEDYMLAARSRFGAQPMAIARVGREVIRGRKRKRLIAMLADQAGPRHGGYWCEFLHRPASFYRGADKLAQTMQLPVLFAQCRKQSKGHYDVEFHTISLPPHDDDSELILKQYVSMAEAAIAAQPETYLWTNRRWKKRPPAELAARFS